VFGKCLSSEDGVFGLLEARLSSCSVDGLLRAVGFAGGGGVLELLGCCNDLVTEGTVSVRRGVVIVIEKDVEEGLSAEGAEVWLEDLAEGL